MLSWRISIEKMNLLKTLGNFLKGIVGRRKSTVPFEGLRIESSIPKDADPYWIPEWEKMQRREESNAVEKAEDFIEEAKRQSTDKRGKANPHAPYRDT